MIHLKNKLSVLLLLLFVQLNAQLIKVNEQKYITLVLPENILKATIGNADYMLSYNTDGEENIALLKAKTKSAQDTNIIIKTSNNFLYNIDISYGKSTTNTIQIDQQLGISIAKNNTTTSQKQNTRTPTNDENIKNNIRENDYTIGNTTINDAEYSKSNCTKCEAILKMGKYVKRINSNDFNIKLDLENVCYNDNKLYVSINIANNSNIDYNINYIKSYIKQSKTNKASNQYLEKNPIEIYNTQRIIKTRTKRKMLFIYDQFTIDNNKELVFELNESNGERNQLLTIPNYIINNPIKIK